MGYKVADNKKIRRNRYVLDTKFVRGVFNGSDHFVVVAKVTMQDKLSFERRGGRRMRARNGQVTDYVAMKACKCTE